MDKILFIVNPISGGKSKVRTVSLIEDCLDSSRFTWEVKYTTGPGDATKFAAETDAKYVVAVGGDGTVDETARGLLGTDKALGIVPSGSGDGLALHLRISRDPKKALKVINDCFTTEIDHGLIDGQPFFCTCGVGMDAVVSRRFAEAGKRGLATYIEEGVKTWFSYKPQTYTLEMDNCCITVKAVCITVGNANQWGNKAIITPFASIQDGLLDVTVVQPFLAAEAPILGAQLLDGRIDRNPHVKCFKCRNLRIFREAGGEAHYDGENAILGRIIEVNLVPRALKVIVPQKYSYKI